MKYFVIILLFPLAFISCKDSKPSTADQPLSLDSLLVLYPDSVNLLVKHGNELLEKYDFQGALADGAKAFRLDSNNIDARLLYANTLNNKVNRETTDIFTAKYHYEYILKKQPKNTDALVGLGAVYMQLMDYDNSFKYINMALHVNPRLRDAYTLKGTNYLKLGNKKMAISSYETAVQQDPEFYEGYIALGNLYMQDNNPIALEYFRTAAKLQPKSSEIQYMKAYAEQTFGHPKTALEVYRRVINMDSSYVEALNQMGIIKQHDQDDIDSAMYFYNSALVSNPKFPEAYYNLGTCYETLEIYNIAFENYSKAVKYNPDFELAKERADIVYEKHLKHIK